jgi:hypothetical protein
MDGVTVTNAELYEKLKMDLNLLEKGFFILNYFKAINSYSINYTFLEKNFGNFGQILENLAKI